MNGFGKLRRSTERTKVITDFFIFLAAAITVLRCSIDASALTTVEALVYSTTARMTAYCRSLYL